MLYTWILIFKSVMVYRFAGANEAEAVVRPPYPDQLPLLHLPQNSFGNDLDSAYQLNCVFSGSECNVVSDQGPWTSDGEGLTALGSSPVKRNHHSRPRWPCSRSLYETKNLGSGYYPKYMRTAACDSSHCDATVECHAIEYKVYVLTRRLDTDSEHNNSVHLPEELRLKWKYVPVIVPVACHCE